MTRTAITALRRGRAVDPGRVLSGPLRAVGRRWLEAGEAVDLVAEGREHAVYVTAGTGTAETPGGEVPLAEGTAVTLPLGSRTTLTAAEEGLEYFHAVLAVPRGGPR
ncbi:MULTISPECIES: hypothetical protein [Kitasatospora]|uniref:Uncharacterized protein n=2 Tax=Kitasatospora TaxID=2063 RepID=A0ABT1ITB7_9ACTN|nr:hypothetical protein [Kitasatospora paracochleata]MCP2308380.1 hypothetical protein [Kitasatospora paracochleata]